MMKCQELEQKEEKTVSFKEELSLACWAHWYQGYKHKLEQHARTSLQWTNNKDSSCWSGESNTALDPSNNSHSVNAPSLKYVAAEFEDLRVCFTGHVEILAYQTTIKQEHGLLFTQQRTAGLVLTAQKLLNGDIQLKWLYAISFRSLDVIVLHSMCTKTKRLPACPPE